ncbi:putative repeat protein (TIGR01451 family) [Streptacidiphilus sp. MAP12-16]|uniref:hypothetical protein n=1 Tax=Streptacidiphilus sp. MAP12-16 TaxID=3156300 RepID=UPI003516022D
MRSLCIAAAALTGAAAIALAVPSASASEPGASQSNALQAPINGIPVPTDADPAHATAAPPSSQTHRQDEDPSLSITKSHAGPFHQGQHGAQYTITVSNLGDGPAKGTATVKDTLPAGLTATAISGVGWSCDLATVSCHRHDSLDAKTQFPPIYLTVDVADNEPELVTNAATLTDPWALKEALTVLDPTRVVSEDEGDSSGSHGGKGAINITVVSKNNSSSHNVNVAHGGGAKITHVTKIHTTKVNKRVHVTHVTVVNKPHKRHSHH